MPVGMAEAESGGRMVESALGCFTKVIGACEIMRFGLA